MGSTFNKAHMREARFVLSILVVVCAASAAVADNLLKNASFSEMDITRQTTQDGLSEGVQIAEWTPRIRQPKDKIQQATFTAVEIGLDGDGAAKIEAPVGQKNEKALAEYWQRVAVEPGKKYFFSVFLRSCEGGKGAYPSVTVEERDASGRQLNYHSAKGERDPSAAATDWLQRSVIFETGLNTTQVTISLRLQNIGGGCVEFDDAQLIPLEN